MTAKQMTPSQPCISKEHHLFTNEAEALLRAYELVRFAKQRVERLGSAVGCRGGVAGYSKGCDTYQPLPAALGVQRGLHTQFLHIQSLVKWSLARWSLDGAIQQNTTPCDTAKKMHLTIWMMTTTLKI